MPFKKTDWKLFCERLLKARIAYDNLMKLEKKNRKGAELDDAINNCWMFGEFALNAALEMNKMTVPQDHTQHVGAKTLFQAGKLKRDYSKAFEELGLYRKKATYGSYVKQRSTHYSTAELLKCLEEMESLHGEVEALLEKEKKL